MDTRTETVHVTLEVVGPASPWSALVSALAPHRGRSLLRFVACEDGRRRGAGPIFVAPGGISPVPPQEAWPAAMTRSFQALCRSLEQDGWVRTGSGAVPWAFRYERPVALHRTASELAPV